MKLIKNIKGGLTIVLMSLLSMSLIVLNSCKEEEDINFGAVELLSFGPAGVQHGEIIKFIGRNMDKVSSIVLPDNVEVSSTQFVTKSKELIEIIVPNEAVAGKVTLKTSQGTIESKTIISFDVPVVITEVPTVAKPGTNIIIKGEFLNWVNEIKFYEELVVDEFVSKTLNELVVKVPMNAQTGKLVFSSGGTQPMTIDSEGEVKILLPDVTSFDAPAVKHGSNLTLKGTDLDLVTGIVFKGGDPEILKANFVSQSETDIVVVVPENAEKGTLTIKSMSPINVISPELKIILPLGTLVEPQPASPGVEITITGTDLDMVGQILFPGATGAVTDFVSKSFSQIKVVVPEDVISGGLTFVTTRGYVTPGPVFLIPTEEVNPLLLTLFDGEFHQGFGDWSWNLNSSQPGNGEQFVNGTASWKADFIAWGGCQMGQGAPGAPVAGGLTTFVFNVYGGPGSDGALIQIVLNDAWGNTQQRNVKEGEWTEFEIPIANFPAANVYGGIHRVAFQLGADAVIWIDKVGFK
ncbi:hypothetical protein [Aquiflexum sp.]|uniref:hypothetical protein n=1 Tax=Aquiflexum sp. TaxID=1872584 RepID=UPI0035932A37